MNRSTFIVAVFCLLASTCVASTTVELACPLDDTKARAALQDDPAASKELVSDQKAFTEIEEQLRTLGQSKLKALFPAHHGDKDDYDGRFVLPLCREAKVRSSDHVNPLPLTPTCQESDDSFNSKGGFVYVLSLGEVGKLFVFPSAQTDFVYGVAIYLNSDSTFVPLRARSDYPARRVWDAKHTEALRQYVHDALAK